MPIKLITFSLLMILAFVSTTEVTVTDFRKLKMELETLKQEAAELRMEREMRNAICQIKHNPCGDCQCVEDYNLIEKHFCDCRMRPTRRDCKEHREQGERINGLYKINNNINGHNLQVFCDQTTDGGGWTVVQRRMDGSENFYRNWTEYKEGFGQLHREHWIGNENIFHLTAQAFLKGSEVRFDLLVKSESNMRWAKYSNFQVDNESTGYELHVSGHSGNIGDMLSHHDGMKYTTYDSDNDVHVAGNCASYRSGAWWYKHCNYVNPNGQYDRFGREKDLANVFEWFPHRLTFSEMKVRRK